MSKNILLNLEYDGTNYSGWQKQNNALTICEQIEKGYYNLTKEKINIIGCGRTDQGVHALDYYCNFTTNTKIEPERISYALNGKLPNDIVIKYSKEVEKSFHSRYDAVKKEYMYVLNNTSTKSAINRNHQGFIKGIVDVQRMINAANYFIGCHDFRSFMASGSSVKDTHRTIYQFEINEDDGIITFNVSGNGFLYKMVRIMVGTLLEIGQGKKEPEEILDILEKKNRKYAGITAKPQGLYLYRVFYK